MSRSGPLVLSALREALAAQRPAAAEAGGRVALGVPPLDEMLKGGIARAALHEIYAPAAADLASATGFAVALAIRAAAGRPLLWVRQDFLDAETGGLHAPGLAEFGLDTGGVLLVRARDAAGVLRAGAEAARCASLGAAVIEPWGDPALIDLTASRRLALAAEASGVMTTLLRVAASPGPSAARTRWLVRAVPSRALAADSPGVPAFSVTLLRNRGGASEREWRVEWNRDRRSFESRARPDVAPLSRPVVPLPDDRPAAAGTAGAVRRAG